MERTAPTGCTGFAQVPAQGCPNMPCAVSTALCCAQCFVLVPTVCCLGCGLHAFHQSAFTALRCLLPLQLCLGVTLLVLNRRVPPAFNAAKRT